ncbi:hypothetical protein HMPREF9999_00378 [Alloprevotella sp. oral taxon 473 str. F0040]|nr:hypothetical protein HMPREF9999_00378 [Alloprevotella sp. oral taxon 473 str. F0040]
MVHVINVALFERKLLFSGLKTALALALCCKNDTTRKPRLRQKVG